jgi:stage II sporulation protein D (peptidoglycan lytic transglycosylase)
MGTRLQVAALTRPALGLVLLATALTLFACYTQDPVPEPIPDETHEPQVRILLVESAPDLTLELAGEWLLFPIDDPERWDSERAAAGGAVMLSDPGTLTVRRSGSVIACVSEDKSPAFLGATELVIRPAPVQAGGAGSMNDGGQLPTIGLGGRQYRGEMRVRTQEDGALRVINYVGIEDYLAGVIGHEMPLSWSDSALHAQAIAARTYALTNLRPAQDHDLKADVRSQVYRGVMAEDARARQMVDDTRAMVVTYRDELVTTFYHSTCGGETVPAAWILGAADIPPLSGATGCRCQASRFYRWTAEVNLGEVDLGVTHASAAAIESWPRGGYAKSLRLVPSGGQPVTITASDLRRRAGLRSTAFTEASLDQAGTILTLEGRGWGHGVGMCQFGAQGFADEEGWDSVQILQHYYPQTEVESLGY